MGDAFIVRRGGISNAFAVIAVTYPAGSVCTCTKGTKTLRAKDTSGAFLFVIPEAGTWSINATDGTRTVGQNVTIINQHQSEHVALAFNLILFENGDKTDTTGGWNTVSATKILSESSVGFSYDGGGESTQYYSRGIRTHNAIDMADFAYLKATITSAVGSPRATLCICSDAAMTNVVSSIEISGNGTFAVILHSGQYYVCFRAYYREYGHYTYNIQSSKVWLE